ncbi:MAG: putative sulfate/molybdate transporter, partial [Methanosarcinales archaeon]
MADLGTIIPFVVGVVTVSKMPITPILLWFGMAYLATGIYFKLPMPVQPMKAIGAIAIAQSLTQREIVSAGVLVGIFFLIISSTDILEYLEKIIPKCVVRGIQLGLGLVIIIKGGEFILKDLEFGILSGFFLVFCIFLKRDWLFVPIVLFFGIISGIYAHGIPNIALTQIKITPVIPNSNEVISSFSVVLSQIPLTIMNSILAMSLLIKDFFKYEVEEKKLAKSVGIMNLVSVPLGGLPMCHGAGGLAAHYRFGARTGGSNIMIGVLFIAIAFFATSELLSIIPYGVLGALLISAGFELGKHSLDTDSKFI